MTKEERKNSRGHELIRFLVTGIVCALIDFIISYFTCSLFVKAGMNESGANALSVSIGFIVSVILNYILSTYWVFTNVENKANTKKFWFILVFIILSAGALGLSIGTMELCALICRSAWNIDIIAESKTLFENFFSFAWLGKASFWLYFVAFCLKTLVGLIWNYFTRKYILYKEPKKEKE